MKRWCSALVVILGCFIASTVAGELPVVRREVPFALGVEYMAPNLAEIYAKTGVKWTKSAAAGFAWGHVEPEPPVNGKHTYNWAYTDKLIL